jgi:hypothetical protein
MTGVTARSLPHVRPVPGDGLLHPAALAAIALLVVDDHLLKTAQPGVITGKLSDVAALVFFPLVLVAAWETLRSLTPGWRGPDPRVVSIAVAATAAVFIAVKLSPAAETAYEVILGIAQWPFLAVVSAASHQAMTAPQQVRFTRDTSDLVALIALCVPLVVGKRRAQPATSA